MNLRERILNADDMREEKITVPEWGDAVLLVTTMTGLERSLYIRDNVGPDQKIVPEHGYADLLIRTCLDPETREPVFNKTDRDILMSKSGAALERVAAVAARINGLTPESQAGARENLPSEPNGASTSKSLPLSVAASANS